MPQNGEKNRKLGFYRSLCCGKEIVVLDGSEFPDCPNHPGLTTIWKPLVDDNIVPFEKLSTSDRLTPRFQVGDQVTFIGVGSRRGQQGAVIEVMHGSLDQVHRYQVRLNNGTWIRCFGFELELVSRGASSKSA